MTGKVSIELEAFLFFKNEIKMRVRLFILIIKKRFLIK